MSAVSNAGRGLLRDVVVIILGFIGALLLLTMLGVEDINPLSVLVGCTIGRVLYVVTIERPWER